MNEVASSWLSPVAPVMRPDRLRPSPREIGMLIVDDETAICRHAERVLRRSGYLPLVASDGLEAIQLAGSMKRLDLLLTDLNMPEMTGEDLARHLRGRVPQLKVLYMTGLGEGMFRTKTCLLDGEALLEKPYSIARLEHAVSLLACRCSTRPPDAADIAGELGCR